MILFFFLYSCKNTSGDLDKNSLSDTIRLHSTSESRETIKEEINIINDSIYDQRKNEIIDFCILFIDALQLKDLKNIEDKIEFPLSVECFVTKERGKIINKNDFINYFDSIFDDSFYKEMDKYVSRLKNSNKIYDYQVGYDLRNEDYFVVGANYLRQIDSDYYDGYSLLFRFEKRKGKYKLILVFCAG